MRAQAERAVGPAPDHRTHRMKRLIIEWLWRLAVLGALLWIGWELHGVREDMAQPAEEQQAEAPADPMDEGDAVRQELAALNQKLDAVMLAMMQLKR
jgi:hypothetical protein